VTARKLEQEIAGLASLGEPARRELYLYVASRAEDVSRDEAARAAGIGYDELIQGCLKYAAVREGVDLDSASKTAPGERALVAGGLA